MPKLVIVSAQINLLVGDIEKNTDRVIAEAHHARKKSKADLIIFPELTLTGYPPEDLLFRGELYERIERALNKIKEEVKDIAVIVGYPQKQGEFYYNKAALIHNQKLITSYAKQKLPNYNVFDEKRYFTKGSGSCIITIKDVPISICICEDLWYPEPAELAVQAGAQLIISLNASPFTYDKSETRESILKQRAQESNIPLIYVNLVGGQDELIFDGGSMVLDETGHICQQAPYFEEHLLKTEFEIGERLIIKPEILPSPLTQLDKIYKTLVLGLKDYVKKNCFPGVLIGLSGGIDSALTLAIAVDALGADQVYGVMMPSRYTSGLSLTIAEEQAKILKIKYFNLSIEPIFETYLSSVFEIFENRPADLTEQNLQARCRGTLLMALSNKLGPLVVSTSNKSETAVGYCTLYGDMVGGIAILKDVYKTLVYELAHHRNKQSLVIPESIIQRPPTAELAENQKDEDSLPPYSILDQILERYVELDQGQAEIVEAGFEPQVVSEVIKKVKHSEHKRRQSPIGIRITRCAFGKDRRYPITSGF